MPFVPFKQILTFLIILTSRKLLYLEQFFLMQELKVLAFVQVGKNVHQSRENRHSEPKLRVRLYFRIKMSVSYLIKYFREESMSQLMSDQELIWILTLPKMRRNWLICSENILNYYQFGFRMQQRLFSHRILKFYCAFSTSITHTVLKVFCNIMVLGVL